MLTEGWDANTVTHILGVRAFGTQLLCEQVVAEGCGASATSSNDDGRFEPEYAEVYGVPFTLHPRRRRRRGPEAAEADPPGAGAARARATARSRSRASSATATSCRRDASTADFTDELAPRARRPRTCRPRPRSPRSSARPRSTRSTTSRRSALQEVAFALAKRLARQLLPRRRRRRASRGSSRSCSRSSSDWIDDVRRRSRTTRFPQLLLLTEHADDAVERIYRGDRARRAGERAPRCRSCALRPGRLDRGRRLRHDQDGLRRPSPTSATSTTSCSTPTGRRRSPRASRRWTRSSPT